MIIVWKEGAKGARGLDFSLSPDEKLFKEATREFLQKTLAPVWKQADEKHYLPTEVIHKMGEQGLFAIAVPEEYGGQGGNFRLTVLAVEEVGYADPALATAVFTLLNNAWPFILYLYGTEEAKKEILPIVGKGRGFFGIASTEPQGGSDVAGLRTKAEKKNGKYVISGEKIFISGVRESFEQLELGSWLLLARTRPLEARHKGLSAFAFIGKKNGAKVDGVEYSILNTIGRHAISTGILTLNEVEVDEKYLIGEENKGFYIAMQGFNIARIFVAAANIGSASWALEQAISWARERKLFDDRPIASFQGVSFPLAEAYVAIESARLLVYRAAWVADKIYIERDPSYKPKDLNIYAAAAKIAAVEAAFKAYETAMKTFGAIAYTKDIDVFRGFLGVTSYLIGAEGTQNIMRYIVARELIGKEYVKG